MDQAAGEAFSQQGNGRPQHRYLGGPRHRRGGPEQDTYPKGPRRAYEAGKPVIKTDIPQNRKSVTFVMISALVP